MEIPKTQILQLLRDRGECDRAVQAERYLPARVDPEQHRNLLTGLGVDPAHLLEEIEGRTP